MTYAELLEAINKGPRQAGGCTPPVVDVARACQAAGDVEGHLLINALLGWEVTNERKAGPNDEAAVMANLAAIKGRRKAS